MLPTLGSPRPRVRQGARREPGGEGEASRLVWAAPPTPAQGLIRPGLPLAAPQTAFPLGLALVPENRVLKNQVL